MDETITCVCGNQEWIIGVSGTRCPKCDQWLNNYEVIAKNISETNKRLEGLRL